MINELVINGYRGIKDLKLNNLGKINIIAGENNTGKTSVLEVIESLERPNIVRAWRFIGRREGNNMRVSTTLYDTMKSLFPINDGDENEISYNGIVDGSEFSVRLRGKFSETIVSEKELRHINGYRGMHLDSDDYDEVEYETSIVDIDYYVNDKECGSNRIYSLQRGLPVENNEPVPIVKNIVYVSPTQHANNTVYLDSLMTNAELYQEFVDIMQQFDPDFISINSVEEKNSFSRKYIVLSKKYKEGLLLNAYGDGMKKAMLLLSAVIRAKGGILLLDEFETAIHISVMRSVFKWILETAVKLDVQIFMTSHSIEAISEVLKCCPEMQEDMRMITLVKTDSGVKARNVDAIKAIQLMDEYGLELR